MKHLNKLLLSCTVLLASCSGEQNECREWDFVNPSVCFFVTDAATGENLLDPASENSICGLPVSVTFEGEKYEMVDASEQLGSRATYVRPLALRLERMDLLGNIKGWHLAFGDFSPTKGYRNRSFTVNWDDGSKTEVKFSLYINWKGNNPYVKSPITVNGKDCASGYYDGWIVRITR